MIEEKTDKEIFYDLAEFAECGPGEELGKGSPWRGFVWAKNEIDFLRRRLELADPDGDTIDMVRSGEYDTR